MSRKDSTTLGRAKSADIALSVLKNDKSVGAQLARLQQRALTGQKGFESKVNEAFEAIAKGRK